MTTLPDRLLAAKFRKRPLAIEAVQYIFDGTTRFADEAQDDIADFMEQNIVAVGDRIEIQTPEGTIYASPGDWIIRGVAGEFYPCKPDIFTATYEPESTALPHMQPAGEAVVQRSVLSHGEPAPAKVACMWSKHTEPNWYFIAELTPKRGPEGIPMYATLDPVMPLQTPPQPSAEEAPLMKCICTGEGAGCTNRCDRGQLPPIPAERITIPQQEAPGAVAWRDPAPHAAAPQPTPSTTLNVTTQPAPVDVRRLLDHLGELRCYYVEALEGVKGYEQRERQFTDLIAEVDADIAILSAQPSEDYKALYEQMCERNVSLDAECARLEAQQPSADAGDGERWRYFVNMPWAAVKEIVEKYHALNNAPNLQQHIDAAIAAQREAGSA